MGFEIRTVKEDEFVAWQTIMGPAFFSHRPMPEAAEFRRPFIDLARCWAAFDGDDVVASLRTFDEELTVPGGATIAADAVTNVTVRATHRRRGALKAMMPASLAQAAERGDPVSILIAARWPIYGRYGYGPAVASASYKIDTRLAAFRPDIVDRGRVQFVDLASGRAAADAIFDRFRKGQVGAIQRPGWVLDIDFNQVSPPGLDPWKGWCVLHLDADGEPDGYLRYEVDDKWVGFAPDCTLTVNDLVAATPDAYAALWRFCIEMDNVMWVKAADRSTDERLRWLLTDGRAIVREAEDDFVWVRVLDVPAALSARRYLTEGRVVLEVDDPLGHAAGRFALEGGRAGATCTRTDETPDLALSAFALGAGYLGGVRLNELATGGLVSELTPGSLATADAMFLSDVTPWCNTWF
jgi:predicted acetyltransferase